MEESRQVGGGVCGSIFVRVQARYLPSDPSMATDGWIDGPPGVAEFPPNLPIAESEGRGASRWRQCVAIANPGTAPMLSRRFSELLRQ